MKYYYQPKTRPQKHGRIYRCNHKYYNTCTLYLNNGVGLAVVMRKFDGDQKVFYWDRLPGYLANDIYEAPGFESYFRSKAGTAVNGLYPTVTVRSIMWALRMKPLPKEEWERDIFVE